MFDGDDERERCARDELEPARLDAGDCERGPKCTRRVLLFGLMWFCCLLFWFCRGDWLLLLLSCAVLGVEGLRLRELRGEE